MKLKEFIKATVFAFLSGLLVYSILSFILPISKYFVMSLLAALFFFVFSLVVYYLGENAIKNTRSGAFLSVIVINTFFKLLASFAFVFVYVKVFQPSDKFFLIPFFLYYICFMVAETYVLSNQAKSSKVS